MKLDNPNFNALYMYTKIGKKIIIATELDGAEHAARVIRHHHENYDGSGYPDGLAGTSISVCSRIITIADNYDAMAVTRSYHNATPPRRSCRSCGKKRAENMIPN